MATTLSDAAQLTRYCGAPSKIGLSLIFAAVLAACGGGGSDTHPVATNNGSATAEVGQPDDGAVPPEDSNPPITAEGATTPSAGPLANLAGRTPHSPLRPFGSRVLTATADAPLGQLTPDVPGALNMTRIDVGQTHMLPNGVRHWAADHSPKGREETLRLKPFQTALAVIDLSAKDAVNPEVEAWSGGDFIGSVPLNPPSVQPKTEDNGPAYRAGSYSAVLPANFIERNVQLKVSATNYAAGNALPLDVTGDSAADIRVLPFFYFGATEENSGRPIATAAQPSLETVRELRARLPMWATVEAHPAGKVVMNTVSLPPNGTLPARIARNADAPGFNALTYGIVFGDRVIKANGQDAMGVFNYAPVAYRYADGHVKSSNTGGVAYLGGVVASGDWDFAGVFIHEMGHAFGVRHTNEGYTMDLYPYPRGSLKGSTWGWDSYHSLLLPSFAPPTASLGKSCLTDTTLLRDEEGRCIKQDIMQGGSGWQAKGQRFGPVADFTAAMMQRNVGERIVAPLGEDSQGNATFQRLNVDTREYEAFTPADPHNGAYGIARGLPQKMNVPVYSVLMSFSMTNPEASQVYDLLHYNGNLLHTMDPTKAEDLAAIRPNGKGKYQHYCYQYGCDFTLHVSYADGSQHYQVVKDGLRPWWSPMSDVTEASQNPLNSSSFRNMVLNVPGDKRLTKVELLYTPKAWEGIPVNPRILVSRDF
ncbi:Peptidase M66 [Roseateles sp. YR242]|uniref:M66 family metalloprotease n=1 Tax=Roseateles sp. YR242 TaxID=1855305 RepID=UPI0008C1ADD4|nr:M66 family metalloprotease [Roseateles sp. YR242]SEL36919.1 Peptidase M66 [Roseateles sp. YR242]